MTEAPASPQRPFFLLTGDDSVRAEGIILVKRLIQDWADFQIVATKEQMSGAGTRANFPGGHYGMEEVDGHQALWVDGTPADAAYFASQYLERPIDLVISGMNLGQNVTNEMHRSGTVGAALTAAQCRQLKALAVSMEVDGEKMFMHHTGTLDERLLEYPGKKLLQLIKAALDYSFPPRTFWNINFPAKPTETIKVVPAADDQYWINDMSIKEGVYAYNDTAEVQLTPGKDVYELTIAGNITVTPCRVEFTDYQQLDKLDKSLV